MRRILILITKSKMWKWFILKALPKIRFSTQLPKLDGHHYQDIYDKLIIGDIILCTDDAKGASLLIPGLMSHAALFADEVKVGKIIEMVSSGYNESTVFDIVKESSRVCIMRLDNYEYACEMINSAKKFKGAKYDVEFEIGVEALYCSELVLLADRLTAHKFNIEPQLKVDLSDVLGLGRPYLSPDGVLFAKNLICVHDTEFEFTGLSGHEIEILVEKNK